MGRKRWALGDGLGALDVALGLGAAVSAEVAVAGTAVGDSVGGGSVGSAVGVPVDVGVPVSQAATGRVDSSCAAGLRVKVGVGVGVQVRVGVCVSSTLAMSESGVEFVAAGDSALPPLAWGTMRSAGVAEGETGVGVCGT
jgi:hypothetical protein